LIASVRVLVRLLWGISSILLIAIAALLPVLWVASLAIALLSTAILRVATLTVAALVIAPAILLELVVASILLSWLE
jgi:hypothetical protein